MCGMDQGIDVRRQKAATTIYVECATQLFEIKVVSPEHSLLQITSNAPALRIPVVGQLVQSIRTGSPAKPFWIGKGAAMQLRFNNGIFVSEPVIAANIKGEGWEYEVFAEPAA